MAWIGSERGTANLKCYSNAVVSRIVVAKSVFCSVLDLVRTRLSVVLFLTNIPRSLPLRVLFVRVGLSSAAVLVLLLELLGNALLVSESSPNHSPPSARSPFCVVLVSPCYS